jgi:hypothetical protein
MAQAKEGLAFAMSSGGPVLVRVSVGFCVYVVCMFVYGRQPLAISWL